MLCWYDLQVLHLQRRQPQVALQSGAKTGLLSADIQFFGGQSRPATACQTLPRPPPWYQQLACA